MAFSPTSSGDSQPRPPEAATRSAGGDADGLTDAPASAPPRAAGRGSRRLLKRLRRLGRRLSDASPPSQSTHPAAGTRFSAAEIHENVVRAADEEMRRPLWELFWSALASGLTIGFSFVAAAYLTLWVPERYRPLAAAAGYPLGFIFVVQARNQLFTENTLEPVIPFLQRRDLATFEALMRLWIIVLIGNVIGAYIFAMLAARTPVLEPSMRAALAATAVSGTDGGVQMVAYRAIFGGWLIALMAWLVSSTHSAWTQVVYVWLTTAAISAFGFRHCIAGAVEAFYRAGVGLASWSAMLSEFLIPAIVGNVLGGVVLVAILNHGQVASSQTRWRRGTDAVR